MRYFNRGLFQSWVILFNGHFNLRIFYFTDIESADIVIMRYFMLNL